MNLVCGFDNVVNGRHHHVLDLQQPLLDGAARLARRYRLVEVDLLHLAAVHGHDVEVGVELQVADAFEALLQVRLDARRIFRFRQNLQHLVVGEEEEPAAHSQIMTNDVARILAGDVLS